MKAARAVTIRDVALRAGVSNATVSRALRNHPAISESTRVHVQAIATEMGYCQNALVGVLAQQLRMTRTTPYQATLGFLTSYPTKSGWQDGRPANLKFFRGALDRARYLGYEIEEIWVKEPGLTKHRLSKILQARSIRGLLVAPMPHPVGHLPVDWSQFASATIGYAMPSPHLHSVKNHHYHAISLALRKLKPYKFSRIGLVVRPEAHQYAEDLYRARYLAYLHTAPESVFLPIYCDEMHRVDFNEKSFRKWYRKAQPQAIVCMENSIHTWLEAMKVSVPGKVALVDLNIHEPQHGWCGIDMLEEEVAATAVDLVVQQLQHNDIGIPQSPKTVLIEGKWIEGSTLPPLEAT